MRTIANVLGRTATPVVAGCPAPGQHTNTDGKMGQDQNYSVRWYLRREVFRQLGPESF